MSRSLIPDNELITREKFLNTLAETYLLQEEILNSTELSVISVTTEGIVTSFNPAAEKMLGYNHQELIGKWTIELIHDGDEIVKRSMELSEELNMDVEPGFETFIAKARATKKADRREWTYIRKNGSRFPVMLSVSGIWNDQGEITGYLGIATDITEQKKSDELIKKSESHLQALLNSIDDIVLEINRQGVYTNIWTRNEHLLFVERDKYIGKTIPEVLRGPLGHLFPIYNKAVLKVFETQQSVYIEYEVPGPRAWRSAKISYIDEQAVLVLVRDITETKLAEQKVRESEQRFRLLAENIPGIIYLCRNDATYSMEYLNERVEEITGFTVREFIDGEINFVQLYHPEDVDYIFREVEKAIINKGSFHLEFRLRHKDGRWLWIEEFGAGIYRNNELVLLEGFLCDITEKKIAREKIAKISDEYDRVFNHSISLNVIAGFDGYFKKVNPVWEKTLGYPLEEFISIPFSDFVHPDDKASTIEATKHLAHGNDIATFENRYQCKDGSYRTLLWTSSSDIDNQMIYASAIDITERKSAEAQMAKVKDENKYIFENSITLSVIADMNGRFIKVNPTIRNILGWTEEEFIGKTALDFLHGNSIQATRKAMDLQAKGISVPALENRFRCKDGSYRWLLWSSYADIDRQLLYGTAIDITERKKTEEALVFSKTNLETAAEELQEQNKQLNEFAHIISHNLRSPVGNIKALISLLDEKSTLDDFRNIFDKLKNTSVNLQETLNDLMETLHVKKEAAGERTPVKFEDILIKIKQDLSAEILQSDAKIISDFQVETIHYSKGYLESILLNLISNSLKYRSPRRHPQIHLHTKETERGTMLSVTDNGLGIDLELYRDKIFGLRKTFHEHKEAKGVGLFLTKTQVEALGGKIWMESEVNKGTTVFVLF